MRYKITLSYDGAPFCGWQRQPDAPSVQEALETALQTLLGEPVSVTGAGRTDTGVSAVGYVAHFDASGEPDASFLACKLNAILPPAVAVLSVEPASPDFHARFDAKKRSYTYYLHRCKDPFMAGRSFFYGYPEVDFELMNKAAAVLPGTHDFSCFQKVGSDARTSVCTVFEAEWRPYTPALEGSASMAPQYWYFRISADRFLRNMVRAIVGTLLEVGRGRRSLDEFAGLILLPSQDSRIAQGAANGIPRRSLAGESVPGHALFLTGIEY